MKINNVLKNAVDNVPFYKKYKNIIRYKPEEKWLYNFPIIGREDIGGNEEEFINQNFNINSLNIEKTSGTTGTSIKCYKSVKDGLKAGRSLWEHRKKFGVGPNSRNAVFYRRLNTIEKNKEFIKMDQQRLFLNIVELNYKRLETYYKALYNFNVEWIFGPVSTLYYLADYIKANSKPRIQSLKLIELTGEKSNEEQRKHLEEMFRCEVTNMYGTTETWGIAYSCPKQHLHILEENVDVELLHNKDDERKNEIVVTSKNIEAMPIIRYKVGDYGYFLNEECNYDGRILELYGGRLNSYFSYKNKKFNTDIFYIAICALNRIMPGSIGQFQFQHISSEKFDMLYVKGPNFKTESLYILDQILEKYFGEKLSVEYKETNFILYDTNGKLNYYKNLLEVGD